MPIVLREQEQLIAAKLEVTYGVDPGLAGANAIMVQDITVNVLEGDVAQRNNYTGYLGNQGSVRLNTWCSVDFAFELSGSGDVDVPPYFAALYKAAGHSELITATTDVGYSLSDDDQDSNTIWYMKGEHKHAVRGLRGTLSLEAGTKQLTRLRFRGAGLYTAPVKVVGGLTGVDFSTLLKPLPWNKETVPVLTLHGVTLNAATFSFEQGQPPEYLALTGQEEVILPARNSTASIKIREDELSVADWYEISRAGTTGALAMQHGIDVTHAGRIFEFNAPNVDVQTVAGSFEQGISYLTLTCGIIPTAKGNDYSFTHR
ncbi:MAG: hypothetical protein M0P11_06900 [Anaerolineaceae bacterium]|nr:hypothetical protein [Anaerolineaceae bacterium]